jgi:hypothetical protein
VHWTGGLGFHDRKYLFWFAIGHARGNRKAHTFLILQFLVEFVWMAVFEAVVLTTPA